MRNSSCRENVASARGVVHRLIATEKLNVRKFTKQLKSIYKTVNKSANQQSTITHDQFNVQCKMDTKSRQFWQFTIWASDFTCSFMWLWWPLLQTNIGSSDIFSLPHTVLVRTTNRNFKFASTYIFFFPFTVWKSNSLRFKMSKQNSLFYLTDKKQTLLFYQMELIWTVYFMQMILF